MMDTEQPASRNAVASCHTRRSNGDGRFSTRKRTRRGGFKVAPFDEHGHETAGTAGAAAQPELRRVALGHDLPVDVVHAVPGVVVSGAVAGTVPALTLRPDEKSTHCCYLLAPATSALPAEPFVNAENRARVAYAHEVDDCLSFAHPARHVGELGRVVADDDGFGVIEDVVDRRHHQARDMR